MAEETKKSTTTTKKRTTTSKPKVEEPKPQLSIEEQMAQMMAMMMAQQQQFQEQQKMMMELILNQQAGRKEDTPIVEEVEVPVVEEVKQQEEKKVKVEKVTKQQLRRDFKGKDIYVMNITQGIVCYQGRNIGYSWENYGDMEPMTIDDLINMPIRYLKAPYLLIDEYENGKAVKEKIELSLGITDVHKYKNLLDMIENNDINKISIDEFEKVVNENKKRGYDISLDLSILIQRKIDRKELVNMHLIGELQKLLGRKFL